MDEVTIEDLTALRTDLEDQIDSLRDELDSLRDELSAMRDEVSSGGLVFD